MLYYPLLFLFNYTMALLGVFPHIFLSHPSDFLKYYMHSDDVVVELQHIMFYTIIAFSFLEYVSNSFPIIIPVNSLFHVKMQGGFIMPASTWIRSHYNVVLAYLHLLASDHTCINSHQNPLQCACAIPASTRILPITMCVYHTCINSHPTPIAM